MRPARRRTRVAAGAAVAVALAITGGTITATASAAGPRVLPANAEAFGKTYGGWAAAWWQYASAIPVSSNPLFDSTGANCHEGQSGPVFFLVGAAGSGSATRECAVSSGTPLFFPLINADDFEPGFTPLQVWEQLAEAFGPITALHASVDGVAVKNLDPATTPYRVCAGPVARCSAGTFSITVPAENLYGAPAGTYEPTVTDGVYLLLAPLKSGHHTIAFGGTGSFFGSPFSQNIIYHLDVT